MSFLQAFLLGLVQGLGEFLPISSSAHLVILPWIAKFPDPGLAFDVALHFGTLIAVVAYFWKDWLTIAIGALRYVSGPNRRREGDVQQFKMLCYLVAATLPAALAGVLLEHWAETTLRNPLLVAVNMVVMGILLLLSDRKSHSQDGKNLGDITLGLAMAIGVAQAFALFPGVSRSGVTITTALFLGINRPTAARFSFLLSTPIIFGACVLKSKYLLNVVTDPMALVGVVTSMVFGFLSIRYLMKLVQNFSYRIFVYYRFVFGVCVGLLYLMRL